MLLLLLLVVVLLLEASQLLLLVVQLKFLVHRSSLLTLIADPDADHLLDVGFELFNAADVLAAEVGDGRACAGHTSYNKSSKLLPNYL